MKVVVGPLTFEVLFSREKIKKESVENGRQGVMGQFSFGECEIHIDPDYPIQSQRETLIHEMLHAVFHHARIDWEKDKIDEERIVTRISPGLTDTLQRSPEAVDFITGRG